MSKPVFQTTLTTRTAAAFGAARQQNGMSLREFGAVLGVTGQQVQNYETGKQLPERASVAEWINSDVAWVHRLGLEIFGAQFGDLIQAVLLPNIQCYG
jgi:transcriptional regulator with XRE-family HTH domain